MKTTFSRCEDATRRKKNIQNSEGSNFRSSMHTWTLFHDEDVNVMVIMLHKRPRPEANCGVQNPPAPAQKDYLLLKLAPILGMHPQPSELNLDVGSHLVS